jgi:8-oxo-dGTP pyrophosphatase MutT (NUDIX family)
MGSEDQTDDVGPGIAAATLILFLEDGRGAAEHLMIQRTSQMRFAPNALVFPGGRVDEDDIRVAGNDALVDVTLEDTMERAHRVTAIREMLEEVGVIVGFSPLSALDVRAMQAALKSKTPFSSLLTEAGIKLDLSIIVPWAKWHPRFNSHRRFDTRFYIARYQGDRALNADVDEVGNARWMRANEAIAEAEAGTAKVIFPTLCNLERLAAYPEFERARAHLGDIACDPISPRLDKDDKGDDWICIPEDSGYPVTRRLVAAMQAP